MMNGIPNNPPLNIEKHCYFTMRQSHRSKCFYLLDLFIRKFCVVMFSAFLWVPLATLGHHIRHVILTSASKEMIGITAQPNVATVADVKAIRNFPKREEVCNPVRSSVLSVPFIFSVSGFDMNWPLPHPTFVSPLNINSLPKAHFKWAFVLPARLCAFFTHLYIRLMSSHSQVKLLPSWMST